jgi:hypothetical protein
MTTWEDLYLNLLVSWAEFLRTQGYAHGGPAVFSQGDFSGRLISTSASCCNRR